MGINEGNLGPLDWIIIFGYMVGLIAMSAWLSRGQHTGKDYYLGSNSSGPWAIALSTMATQCSTNSLLGVPAFVAFSGGLVWLQYELGVPFAMIALILLIMPILRGMNLISVYQYVEDRFSLNARLLLSALFLILRAFATGVTIYGVGLTIAKVLNVDFFMAVLILMIATIVYDFLGGMKAVIWSDVIQIILIFGSIIAAVFVAVHINGGISGTLAAFPPERMKAIDFKGTGLGDGQTYSFWPMLIGGFFLYVAYYGCDQTQAQRSLSTRNVGETNQALFIGGLLRFPLVLSYCLLGVAIGAHAAIYPEFVDTLQLHVDAKGEPEWNLALPVFVLQHFPTGLIGVVMVGILGAAMSSLDSTLNSMSAVTMQDFVHRLKKKPLSDRQELYLSKATTVLWGLLCLAFSFYVGGIATTVVESVNKIGSLLNGPLLALFTMGLLTRFIGARAVIAGLLLGLTGNALLWLFAPGVSWLWWNVFGFIVAWVVGLGVALIDRQPVREIPGAVHVKPSAKTWRSVAILAAYGVLIGVGLAFM
ncbi:sodium:solute symporter family transporter [Cerasicoccus arenae]|uniref:Transporter n=1 Tax=Cerasicoccus arenae TaxID=424488 RepID=A0A8J3D9W7_9BACT|nr:sodium/solute symporter [Cerasicoccus arenae]MBK1859488.1 sodium/solute symporter [Cerasicoccus arenae]GHB94928.1 transporter [Cerasicoccus arenae]